MLEKRSRLYRLFHRHKKAAERRLEEAAEQRRAKLESLMPKVNRAPAVYLGELADSSVNLKVCAWTRTSDYWGLYYSMNERIYNELPRHGISFPFPQLDVHLPHTPAEQQEVPRG